ncbi:transposase [Massilia umbonata]|uniref:Transposase n=1 Tax=Pseudoduganella umbonata TaxID=864828 RepID=A0A7W5EDX4_9BURK|nr:transposase [Pseudoduganella umbonata]
MARQRRSFSEEFKREAVKLVDLSGASKSGSLLARWYREEEAGRSPAAKASNAVSAEEYERMRRELAKVKTERDILKRRSATSLQSPSEVRLYCQA